ncbi:MAG TPA: SRPBCC domain-containing protein [Devosia sp.]|nr:SRPBCC domain-containing protein [Devosia sp.]
MADLRFEAIYPAPVAAVWRALTDPDEIAGWLMPNDFVPMVGHQFTFTTSPAPGFDGTVHCEVLEIEPERRLSYSWAGGGIDTVVAWELEPHGEGTALRLRHSGFHGPRGLIVRRILGAGWKSRVLPRLGSRVEALAEEDEGRLPQEPAP